jgi:hypothetical protein
VRQCVEESVARLQTDVVGLYYLDRRDLTVPGESVGEVLDGRLARLVRGPRRCGARSTTHGHTMPTDDPAVRLARRNDGLIHP